MGIKIKFHFTFYIFLFFVIYFGGFSLFLSYFVALFIHEYSHYLLSKSNNIVIETINIYPFGMCLNVNATFKNKLMDFLIFFIGPFSNILLLLITVSIWWCYPITYFYTSDFVLANFVLGFFNLIPLYPLDGGNMILSAIRTTKDKIKALKIMKFILVVVGCAFFALFIYSWFYTINFSCFSIAFFMFSSLMSYKDYLNKEIENKFQTENIKQQKAYVINLNTGYEDIKKCFDDNYYIQFYVVNDENKIVKILSQEEIKKVYDDHFKSLINY